MACLLYNYISSSQEIEEIRCEYNINANLSIFTDGNPLDRKVKKAHDHRHIIIPNPMSVNHIDGDECIYCIISYY
jgi:hypothetical protein